MSTKQCKIFSSETGDMKLILLDIILSTVSKIQLKSWCMQARYHFRCSMTILFSFHDSKISIKGCKPWQKQTLGLHHIIISFNLIEQGRIILNYKSSTWLVFIGSNIPWITSFLQSMLWARSQRDHSKENSHGRTKTNW